MRWQYMFVEFNTVNQFTRVLRINDVPVKEPEPKRQTRYEFCNQAGFDGWEMVNVSSNIHGDRADLKSLIVFKRPYSDKSI